METPLPTDEQLPQLQARIAQLSSEVQQYKALANLLHAELDRLRLGLAGPSRERFTGGLPEGQLTLEMLAAGLEASGATQTPEGEPPAPQPPAVKPVRSHVRKVRPTGRQIPENLPRVELETLPEEVRRDGLDAFERIGQEVNEVVERRRGGLVVVRVVRPKFVRKGQPKAEGSPVMVAPTCELPIEQGMAGPALLAETVVQRWNDHLPLHRLESIYAREGWTLARSTTSHWHLQLAELCTPLLTAMWEDSLAQDVLLTDATGVLVQAKERCRRTHFFVVVAPERHVLFRHTQNHTKLAVGGMLKGYRGYLVADAHTVYDHLYVDGKTKLPLATECGCWAHVRRYFFKALSSDPRAAEGIKRIGVLFEWERKWASLTPEERKNQRAEKSAPLVADFYDWLCRLDGSVLEESPLHRAMVYARNQRAALGVFLKDGRIPIHNNRSERELRREAIGRKNWLFVGSEDGAHANATFVSLLASCQMHGLEPTAYLRDLFCLLPTWKHHRVLELAPLHWAETRLRPEVAAALETNPFRRVALGMSPSSKT